MNEPDLLEKKDLIDTVEYIFKAAEEANAAILKIDFCIGCYSEFSEYKYPAILGISLRAGESTYSGVVLDLCFNCSRSQDYNTVKKNLSYWIAECPAKIISKKSSQ